MICQAAIDLIKRWEGCKLKAYRCSAGVWTIGIGNTRHRDGSPVKEGDILESEEEAEELFRFWLLPTELVVRRVAKDATENQVGAFCSLTYNIGTGAFQASSVLRCHNRGDYEGAARHFNDWKKVRQNGLLVISNGLVARRADERKLYEEI